MTPEPDSASIRVLLVDAPNPLRDATIATFEQASDTLVVGIGDSGDDAIRLTRRTRPDVLALSAALLAHGGLDAIREIMHTHPLPIVIIASPNVPAGHELNFEALRAGALTIAGSPDRNPAEQPLEILQTVRLMADVPVIHHWQHTSAPAAHDTGRLTPTPVAGPAIGPASTHLPDVARLSRRLQVIGIAASTGGPSALATLLAGLPANYPIPILVVQHVTAGFTPGLVAWLNKLTPLNVTLAQAGVHPEAGDVLIAPDGYHLQINSLGLVHLGQQLPYKGLRPSANFLFAALAESYGSRAIGIVLTGMGDDGTLGLLKMMQRGALTIAQDEASSIVFGMPHQAITHGAITHVLPLPQIAALLSQITFHTTAAPAAKAPASRQESARVD